jgi:hypothetical protein
VALHTSENINQFTELYNNHPDPEYRFFISLVSALSIAIVTTGVSDGARDTLVLDGEGVSRPLRYGLNVAVPSALESIGDERRLRFDNCGLQKYSQTTGESNKQKERSKPCGICLLGYAAPLG